MIYDEALIVAKHLGLDYPDYQNLTGNDLIVAWHHVHTQEMLNFVELVCGKPTIIEKRCMSEATLEVLHDDHCKAVQRMLDLMSAMFNVTLTLTRDDNLCIRLPDDLGTSDITQEGKM